MIKKTVLTALNFYVYATSNRALFPNWAFSIISEHICLHANNSAARRITMDRWQKQDKSGENEVNDSFGHQRYEFPQSLIISEKILCNTAKPHAYIYPFYFPILFPEKFSRPHKGVLGRNCVWKWVHKPKKFENPWIIRWYTARRFSYLHFLFFATDIYELYSWMPKRWRLRFILADHC